MAIGGPAVIAHRGASAYALENTLAAFDLALELGADVIELDLRPTADGVPVVVHDETLERTAGDPRAVAETLEADLCELPEGLRPLRLEEVLERYGQRARYLLDLKDPRPDLIRAAVRTVDAMGLRDRVQVQTFDRRALRLVHRTGPGLSLAQLYPELMPAKLVRRDLARVARFATAIGPHILSVDAELVDAAGSLGLQVQPWTVNDRADMERLLALGVHGLITDVPDIARATAAAPALAAA